MNEVVDFLRELYQHNDRNWFEQHRPVWLSLQERFRFFAKRLIDGLSTIDADVEGLTVADCTYRIYRDTRFSADKSPYKTWLGIFVAPHGKRSGYAGYYFHLEGEPSDGLAAGHMLWAGLHCPDAVVLQSVREEMLDHSEEFAANIRRAEGFSLDCSEQLRRTPKGFPTGTPQDAWLRLKEVGLYRALDIDLHDDEVLLNYALDEFRKTAPFVQQLNRAVQYAHEEMM
jgi:uncharacterized protein (TIGR02453 family)